MTAVCVVFDVGGVLEITPETGWTQRWEERLELPPGTVNERMRDVWRAGSVGIVGEQEVHEQVAARLGLDASQVEAFMADLWAECLGAPNEELTARGGRSEAPPRAGARCCGGAAERIERRGPSGCSGTTFG